MEDDIITLYEEGLPIEDISDELGISETKVFEILENNGYL